MNPNFFGEESSEINGSPEQQFSPEEQVDQILAELETQGANKVRAEIIAKLKSFDDIHREAQIPELLKYHDHTLGEQYEDQPYEQKQGNSSANHLIALTISNGIILREIGMDLDYLDNLVVAYEYADNMGLGFEDLAGKLKSVLEIYMKENSKE